MLLVVVEFSFRGDNVVSVAVIGGVVVVLIIVVVGGVVIGAGGVIGGDLVGDCSAELSIWMSGKEVDGGCGGSEEKEEEEIKES